MSNVAPRFTNERLLLSWSNPPSDSEDKKCTNAESVIKGIFDRSAAMKGVRYTVFAQGSYKNGTNIKHESDVDVCVLSEDSCIYQYNDIAGLNHSSQGIGPAPYSHAGF